MAVAKRKGWEWNLWMSRSRRVSTGRGGGARRPKGVKHLPKASDFDVWWDPLTGFSHRQSVTYLTSERKAQVEEYLTS